MSVKTTVTLPEEVVQLLDAYAAERGCLRKDIIIEAIKEYLEHYIAMRRNRNEKERRKKRAKKTRQEQ